MDAAAILLLSIIAGIIFASVIFFIIKTICKNKKSQQKPNFVPDKMPLLSDLESNNYLPEEMIKRNKSDAHRKKKYPVRVKSRYPSQNYVYQCLDFDPYSRFIDTYGPNILNDSTETLTIHPSECIGENDNVVKCYSLPALPSDRKADLRFCSDLELSIGTENEETPFSANDNKRLLEIQCNNSKSIKENSEDHNRITNESKGISLSPTVSKENVSTHEAVFQECITGKERLHNSCYTAKDTASVIIKGKVSSDHEYNAGIYDERRFLVENSKDDELKNAKRKIHFISERDYAFENTRNGKNSEQAFSPSTSHTKRLNRYEPNTHYSMLPASKHENFITSNSSPKEPKNSIVKSIISAFKDYMHSTSSDEESGETFSSSTEPLPSFEKNDIYSSKIYNSDLKSTSVVNNNNKSCKMKILNETCSKNKRKILPIEEHAAREHSCHILKNTSSTDSKSSSNNKLTSGSEFESSHNQKCCHLDNFSKIMHTEFQRLKIINEADIEECSSSAKSSNSDYETPPVSPTNFIGTRPSPKSVVESSFF